MEKNSPLQFQKRSNGVDVAVTPVKENQQQYC